MHHTRRSGKSSPLIFEPEIEKSTRQNRVVQRENKATKSPIAAKTMNPDKQSESQPSEPVSSQPQPPPTASQQPPTPTFPKLSDPPFTTTASPPPTKLNMPNFRNYPPFSSKAQPTFSIPPPVTTRFEQGGFSGDQEGPEYEEDYEFEHNGYEDD